MHGCSFIMQRKKPLIGLYAFLHTTLTAFSQIDEIFNGTLECGVAAIITATTDFIRVFCVCVYLA